MMHKPEVYKNISIFSERITEAAQRLTKNFSPHPSQIKFERDNILLALEAIKGELDSAKPTPDPEPEP